MTQVIKLSAGTVEDIFGDAARALAEASVDPATVPSSIVRYVSLEAPSLQELLLQWLSVLLYIQEWDSEVYRRAHVQVMNGDTYRLSATLKGGRVPHAGVRKRACIPVITNGAPTVERARHGWQARFVLDVAGSPN